MTLIVTFAITLLVGTLVGLVVFRHLKTVVVNEDSVAITANRDGFIKRVLPAGRHLLRPFEHIDFNIPTKTSLATGRAMAIATGDGILAKIDWSGTYSLHPGLITESKSQRLRNLPNADKAIARNADILLRKLVGNQSVRDLFNPVIRERLERQLSQVMADKLKPLGIVFNGLNLQSIELPPEVAEAMNKAKAIETLDGAIRQVDPTTREVVRGAYHLDEILHWDRYLPVPSRMTMKRLAEVEQH